MSPLRLAYLGLALWGAVHPGLHLARFVSENGFPDLGLIAAWQANAATTALAWELVIAAGALILWICAEVSVRRNWSALVAIPAALLIGVGCGLPLYLFLRTRPI